MDGQQQQNINQAPQKVYVNAAAFGAKAQSKREVYRFVASECGAYVPPYNTVTIWHIKELASGARTRIKATEVKHINVPQFKGLTIETMFEYAQMFPEVIKCLPLEDKETLQLPRQYLANVIFTVVGKAFQDWVDVKIEARNAKVVKEANMNIELDPEIAAIFNASTAVSGKYPHHSTIPFVPSDPLIF